MSDPRSSPAIACEERSEGSELDEIESSEWNESLSEHESGRLFVKFGESPD